MNNNQEWYSVTELEKKMKIPNASVRRYIRNHGHHLHIRKKGKVYFVNEKSITVLKKIRELYELGKEQDQVDESLNKLGIPTTIVIEEDEKEVAIEVGETIQQLKKGFIEQQSSIEELKNLINKQQEYLEERLNERDHQLLEVLRVIQESKKQVAASNEVGEKKRKWYMFWKRA